MPWETRMSLSDESVLDPVARLAEEFVQRYRAGERPPLSEYTDKHPELAGRIREVFPLMVALEEAGPGTEDTVGWTRDRAGAAGITHTQVGGYRVVREIGRGGMGVVYEAVQLALGRL